MFFYKLKKNRRLCTEINKGFTLVELVIVLTILAILAAILIPVLLGYIDEAKNKQNVLNAKNCLNAAQTELTKLYAKQSGVFSLGTNVIPDVPASTGLTSTFSPKNGDTDLRGKDFANRVLDLTDLNGDKKPYCLIIGVGSNNKSYNKTHLDKYTTKHDKYTVYYILYIDKKGDDYIYYYNGDWTTTNPSKYENDMDIFDGNNYVLSGELKDKRIQYYLISYKGSYNFMQKEFWTNLKKGTV